RADFAAWLLSHAARFHLRITDILTFLRDLQVDRSFGIEALYRRSAAWQHAVPNGLESNSDQLRVWLAVRYKIADPWLNSALPAKADHHVSSPLRGVNLLAHFCYPCGLEIAARATRATLIACGWDVSCRDVPNNERTDRAERSQWLGLHPYPTTIVQLAPERL